MSPLVRLLTHQDVQRALVGVDLVGLMEAALGALSAGDVVQPLRSSMLVGPERAYLGLMPAHIASHAALGLKLVTVFNANRAQGLPSHFATILLLDDATGMLRAVMDGSHITEARTAAVSAVAVRHLQGAPPRRMALLGSGAQARSHLRALVAEAPSLQEVRVWSPRADLAAFVREISTEVAATLVASDSAEAASRGADLIVLVTSSPHPVLDRRWVQDGALVVSVGACRPDQREMDPELVSAARLVVDSRAAALVESGDVVQGIAEGRFGADHIRAELGEVVRSRVPIRQAASDVVVFKSLGLAVEDVAVAHLVLERAAADGLGTLVAL
ncbi:delta(1)-pyrroline-2-carboxylate reductase [Luteitalea sp. TBR-22]|uniref:ornithine cyclodeaminase family protein n=1 Tax=Luteitalea sp. TBR-22 TaxID=2802971 RepID=UPI001AF37D15|nr:ornithine cyclodeaminase family protein [Luteitalea sp. TBR-22]BCS32963.1 delta(1)-pyrroline-2-carboxylate reductase [Luteitalea sp. TBR-22]